MVAWVAIRHRNIIDLALGKPCEPCAMVEKYSEAEWAYLRDRFADSVLKEVEIAKLGQNVGLSWPFRGSDETPAKYVELGFDELASVPGLVGRRSRVRRLMDILRETLAFDDPFSEMVDMVEAGQETDDTFEKVLRKLGVPLEFPVDRMHFSTETRALLRERGAKTVIDAVHAGRTAEAEAEGAAGNDLKRFVNSLAHEDGGSIGGFLPYRPGEMALHFIEKIGLVAADLDAAARLELLRQAGRTLTEKEAAIVEEAGSLHTEAALKAAIDEIKASEPWFPEGAKALVEAFSLETAPERLFIAMDKPDLEPVAVELGRAYAESVNPRKRGLRGKFFGFLGR